MALGFGANARLLAAFEATYGSPPTDNYHRLGFSRYGLSARQRLIYQAARNPHMPTELVS